MTFHQAITLIKWLQQPCSGIVDPIQSSYIINIIFMKRNLLITVAIFVGILILMLLGDIITIGDKLANVTDLWYMELIFYLVIFGVFTYFVLYPVWKVHHAPELPCLSVEGEMDLDCLKNFGYQLARNCYHIKDDGRRKEHSKQLINLIKEWGDEKNLPLIIDNEVNLRLNGDDKIGVKGINDIIKQWSQTVFMVTAISQNSKVDTFSVLVLNYSMIKEIVYAAGFRPTGKQMLHIYWSIFTTAVLSFCVSEALSNVGSVAPFSLLGESAPDFSVDVDEGPDMNVDSDIDADFENVDSSDSGFSLSSILHKFKIPGFIIGPLIDGTLNSLMTLRIGYVTRAYLVKGSKAFSNSGRRKEIRFHAVAESVKSLPFVVLQGCRKTSKGMYRVAKFIFSSDAWRKYEKCNS